MLRCRSSAFQWFRENIFFTYMNTSILSKRTEQRNEAPTHTLTLDRAIIPSATSSALIEGLIVAYCPL